MLDFQHKMVSWLKLFFATFAGVRAPTDDWNILVKHPNRVAFQPTFVTDDLIFRFATTFKTYIKMTKTRAIFGIITKMSKVGRIEPGKGGNSL